MTPKEELFKDLKGYENLYSISTNGVIKSKRKNKTLKHEISKHNKIHSVRIYDENGKSKRQSIVRLMASTFIENTNPNLYTNAININGNHNDLRVDNIMWGTSYIQVDRTRKRYPKLNDNFVKSGVKIRTSKMNDELINSLLKMRELGYSVKQLTDIFPIKKSQIFNILKKHNK
jgi:hypothetical protein